ncbi:uncharacterized protein LOC120134653 [Hibiscus syriacus]|uniref:uncharacterized protein LOC120134653 n=1 Tax=Hibiscus syriacus TaxID=106335 RepID=UPI0019237E3D|nr:uncharacterized protein LOC120134653 [Hibiscus syriacus]
MKLDNEQVVRLSTIGYNSDSKPCSFLADTKSFENKEKPLDSTGLSADEIVKDNRNGTVHDEKGDELTASELDCFNSAHDFANGNEKEVRDFVTSNSHSLKNTDSFQDSFFYFDRSVMECQLPELVVCYKESTYHVVKDICIDEGVPTQGKFMFDTGVDEKSGCYFPQSENDQDSKLMKEWSEIDMPMQDDSFSPEGNHSGKDIDNDCGSNKKQDSDTRMQDVPVSLEENESNKGIPNQCDSKDLMMTTEMKDDEIKVITDDVSKELFTVGDVLSMPDSTTVKSEAMSTNLGSDGMEQQSFKNASKNEVIVVSAVNELNNPSEEEILSAPTLVSSVEESDSGKGEAFPISPARASASEEETNSSLVKQVSDDSKLETGTITSDSGSSAPTTGKDDREPLKQVSDDSKLETGTITSDSGSSAPTTSKDDRELLKTGRTPEDETDSPFSNCVQHGYGESSFSAAGPVTGLISYSGPIAYSGNLSHRSDSSTTSTRSFAFPLLQSEWNSSPVRMAKADRRQYRKHCGWRHSFLCCKF